MKERWKPVFGYEGLYEVSDLGRIKYLARFSGDGHWRPERISAGFRIARGYMAHSFQRPNATRQQLLVHGVVLRAFIGPIPPGMEACHNDGDATNNCLRNLRYDSHAENNRDRIRHGTIRRGETAWNARLTEQQALSAYRDTRSALQIARELGVDECTILDIKKRRTWVWLTQQGVHPRPRP